MKNFSIILRLTGASIIVIYSLLVGASMAAADYDWEAHTVGASRAISRVIGVPGYDAIYVSSEKGLFLSRDNGNTWKSLALPGSGGKVSDIDLSGGTIGVVLSRGACIGEVYGNSWQMLEGKTLLRGVMALPKERVVFRGEKRFYGYQDNGLTMLGSLPGDRRIDASVSLGGAIFAMSSGELYCSKDMARSWKKIYTIMLDPGEDDLVYDEDGEALPPQDVLSMKACDDTVTVATQRGIILANSNGDDVRRINTQGLPSSSVQRAIYVEGDIFAATYKRVFKQSERGEAWVMVLDIAASGSISDMDYHVGKDGSGWLIVSASGKVFISRVDEIDRSSEEMKTYEIGVAVKEPTIQQVHKMAIEYAEVSPDKIIGWRTGAKWKAVMPRLSVGFSESVDDNVDIYKSSTSHYVVKGPRERDNDWSIDLTWDLSEIIWNSEQTSIDVRSKLMVQLREDILEEVTRLYFERKKLLMELQGAKPADPAIRAKYLRVEELTAYIDALTGGGFSRALHTESG